ncbi:hypothetical protein BAE44_0005573 [Dichanthelium oligosanthes]|uniref:Acidic protein n=1 Tax=Dichanthelium oligosanthes TaxID=888268 RepID=A0A1E5W844_9POAL|nr:hypothetical protein BAE44_0005573 [Dichanthelium oligosanthes]
MASFSGAMVKMSAVVAVFVAVVLLSNGPPAMADLAADCLDLCRPGCQAISAVACRNIDQTAPDMKQTCDIRTYGLCATLCMNYCTANTLPPLGNPICINGV